jgi:nickel-type superoxide dismutase maturation protease
VVAGRSMEPAILPGDRLLYLRTRSALAGDVVVVDDPTHPGRLVVKRVTKASEGTFELRGDNSVASTDSRDYGPVPMRYVQGRAIYRYFPSGRAGRL